MKRFGWILVVIAAIATAGCDDKGEQETADKAKIEGKATAEADLMAQLEAQEQLVEKARREGKAAAEAELQVQKENMDILIQKARAEGKATAEAELAANNANLAAKAQLMEADLATRHLFYQALRGTYEGSIPTERGEFKVRITLVPSLPPYTASRTRQLEEIVADINNLYFNAQIVQWNPANRLSAVGCRIENLRPDIVKGELSIASASCPNFYGLRISDTEIARVMTESTGSNPNDPDLSREVATAIRDGKLAKLTEIRGEVHPTTNAAIYQLSVTRLAR